MTTKMIGTGSYLPEHVVSNDDLAKLVDTSDEWIASRTGIRNRRIATKESGADMAAAAAEEALKDAGMDGSEIDLILVATCSSDFQFPSTACLVQKAIHATNAAAFDLSAACSGFLFALHTAHAYICAGIYKNILLVGVEVLSKLIDWNDRSTCVLFGDGAGAAVLKSEDMRYYLPVTHSDGSKGEALCCRSRYDRSELSPEDLPKPDEKEYLMQMDGREVFMFAVKSVPQAIKEVLEKNDTAQEEISFYILHQANRRIVEAIAKRLGEPIEKFPMNLEEYGNTSSASIPILLDELNRAGKLNRGQKIILAGFGAGLTWGASILEW
mgnify:CR=1 FL=1